MSRPKKLMSATKTYNLTIPINLFDRLAKISLQETKNSLEHVSIADLIRSSIEVYVDVYEKENVNGKS